MRFQESPWKVNPAVIDYLDMVNIMAYDVARPPYHHAPLYRSEYAGRITTDEAVKAHLNAGVPKEKLVLGIPLYGHGVDSLPDYTYYGDILNLKDYNFHWDEEAKVPYATDKNGKFVLKDDYSSHWSHYCGLPLLQW